MEELFQEPGTPGDAPVQELVDEDQDQLSQASIYQFGAEELESILAAARAGADNDPNLAGLPEEMVPVWRSSRLLTLLILCTARACVEAPGNTVETLSGAGEVLSTMARELEKVSAKTAEES